MYARDGERRMSHMVGMGRMALVGLCVLLGMVSCSNDEEQDAGTSMAIMSYAPLYVEQTDRLAAPATTRAAFPPSGFVTYDELVGQFPGQASNVGATMKLFFTTASSSPLHVLVTRGKGGQYRADCEIDADNYYIYGFVPSNAAESSSITSGDYASGATITINGLSTVSAKDVCVTIGVKHNDADLAVGNFAASIGTGDNSLFLLYDHLYAGMRFTFKVDAGYAALRTIKIKEIHLQAYKDAARVKSSLNATVELTANATGDSPITSVTYTSGSDDDADATLFKDDETPITLSPTEPSSVLGLFIPASATRLDLVTTYDVYDSAGNLIRADETATNKLIMSDVLLEPLQRGRIHTVNITVNPSYLYMLSDPDMDNPSFTVTK